MSKKNIPTTEHEPIIVLDWTTNTVWRGNIPSSLHDEQIEEWLKEKGINTKNCHWMIGNFTYEDINP